MRLVARIALVVLAFAVVAAATASCGNGSDLFRQYEYEEEVYLSLDGSATMYVNASVPALDALRGASFNPAPNAPLDLDAVRAFFTTPATHVTRVNTSRRSNRRFVHVRLDVDDVGKLAGAAPFGWSSYRFAEQGNRFVYQQTVGPSAGKAVAGVHWTGGELVAFRLHLPSTIVEHNAGERNYRRGNILVWEQPLTDRLAGRPLTLDAQMETESILAHTLWLFAATFAAAATAFGLVVWLLFRRGASHPMPADQRVRPGAGL